MSSTESLSSTGLAIDDALVSAVIMGTRAGLQMADIEPIAVGASRLGYSTREIGLQRAQPLRTWLTRWPASGSTMASMARRNALTEPGNASTTLPRRTPPSARLRIVALPISA